MLNKIANILSNYSKKPASDINEDTVLTSDLGLSSYDVVRIVTDFEDSFDIEIPDKEISKFQTVKDIIDYLSGV